MRRKLKTSAKEEYRPREKTEELAIASLMSLCAKSEKSSADARRLLYRWGITAGRADTIITKLIREKFIDDERYARAYFREKSRLNGWGQRKIRAMLSSKGIAPAVIESASEEIAPDTAVDKLRSMMQKKIKTIRYKDQYDLKGKLVRYGAGLGYNFGDVAEIADILIEIHFTDDKDRES